MLWGLGTIALLWFLDGMRERLSLYSDQYGRLAFFFGFGVALLMLASFLPDIAGAFASDELDGEPAPGAAQVIGSLGDGFFFGAEVMLAGLFRLANGGRSGSARHRVGRLVLAAPHRPCIHPADRLGCRGLGLPLWILIVAVLMWRSAEPAAVEPA